MKEINIQHIVHQKVYANYMCKVFNYLSVIDKNVKLYVSSRKKVLDQVRYRQTILLTTNMEKILL